MISLTNISKKYKHNIIALDDVTVKFPNQGLVFLTGENGCGKTTLLNIIATMDCPTLGSVCYNNIEYKASNYKYLRNTTILYIVC